MKSSHATVSIFLVLALCLGFGSAAQSAELKDAESTKHGYDAAWHQIVDTYTYPGFKVVQFNLPVLSHYSYILISGNEALVIDPDRDIKAYLDYSRNQGLTIKGVYLTHSHADFIAGHLEMVKALGCPIYQSAKSGAVYRIEPLQEGSTLQIGQASIKFIETPGHTPDSTSAVVYGSENKNVPQVIFTGDMLFVGSVGRPDLLEGKMTAQTLASMSFDTWQNKLSTLGDAVVVLPAHGAGSLCGAHLSDKPSSTIGQEKTSNPYAMQKSQSEYIAMMLQGLPEAPQYFKHNVAINRQGPELINWDAPLPAELSADRSITDTSRYYTVDLRNAQAYADGHIPNSVNIGLRGRFETWVGIMVPWDAKLVLTGSGEELIEALFRLHRVGYKADVITIDSWTKANLPINKNEMIKPVDLYAMMQKGDAPVIVDVRLPEEWMGLRIGTVINLPLNHLAELSSKLDPSQPVVTVCNSAYRSSMAVGVLEGKGFTKVSSMEGGSEAWINAGLPVYAAASAGGPAAQQAQPKREIHLAERTSADEVKRLMMDLPGTFDLVDIRPAQQFADYNLPGSRNVDIADLLNNPAYLTGAGPLIIVDRDGSLAMMVGGILSQKTQRQIKVLYGGVEEYWRETELKPAVREVPIPGMSSVPKPSGPAVGSPPAISPQPQPQSPKKKSAGC